MSQGHQELIPYKEIQKHNSVNDCWVIINVRRFVREKLKHRDRADLDFLQGLVYDLTRFLELHPGGQQAILSEAGTDVR